MNFNELNQKLGGIEIQSDWRRAKGGGWIYKNATVEHEENITDNAIVSGNARVSGNAFWGVRRGVGVW